MGSDKYERQLANQLFHMRLTDIIVEEISGRKESTEALDSIVNRFIASLKSDPRLGTVITHVPDEEDIQKAIAVALRRSGEDFDTITSFYKKHCQS